MVHHGVLIYSIGCHHAWHLLFMLHEFFSGCVVQMVHGIFNNQLALKSVQNYLILIMEWSSLSKVILASAYRLHMVGVLRKTKGSDFFSR